MVQQLKDMNSSLAQSYDSVDFIPAKKYSFPFLIVLIYLLFEYGRPQTFFPFIRVLHPGWILAIIMSILLIRKGNKSYLFITQSKLFIGLIILMSIHGPIATNNYWAFIIWKDTVLYFIVFLSIINFVSDYSRIEPFINLWIIINLIGAIIGIISGGYIPNSAFMGDENDFSLVMNMAIPFSYFMFLENKSKQKKVLYLLATFTFIFATVSSFSRGGFIGLVLVISYCWIKTPRKIVSSLIIIVIVFILALSVPSHYWDEVKSIREENIEAGTGAQRWYFWKVGLRMFLDNPIIGVGQGNYPWVIEKYEDPGGGYQERYHGGRPAHSIYITMLAELGIIGSLILISIIVISLHSIHRFFKLNKALINNNPDANLIHLLNKIKYINYGVLGALIGYLSSGAFLSVLYYPHLWILFAILISVSNIQKQLIYYQLRLQVQEGKNGL